MRNKDKNIGIMNLNKEIPLKTKQILAGKFSSKLKSEKSIEKIINSARTIKESGSNITQNKVVLESGLSLKTIKRYWSLVDKEFNLYKYK